MRAMRAMRFAAVFLLAASGCANPRVEANVAEQLSQAADDISGLKSDLATLQTEVDSLRGVVASHDTLITRLSTPH
jgi:peptidoglycan hydrolase CwlO-like protein